MRIDGILLAVCWLLIAGCGGPPEPGAVVLVVVDTLRADHLGLYGYERPTSPEIDRRAASAAVFDRALATSSWTLPTFGTLLTGRLPSRHAAGTRLRETDWQRSRRLDETLPTLPEILADAGWRTGAIVNNPWLERKFGLARGFETYDYKTTSNRRTRRADQVVDGALDWIDDGDGEPFVLLLHLFDPHMGYDAPEPFRGRFTQGLEEHAVDVLEPEVIRRMVRTDELDEGQRAWLAAAYDEEIAFVDRELGRLFDGLEERGLWDRSLIVLTSDHGEELFDHGGFEHGHSMYQEILRVPLLIWGPDIEGRLETRPVSLVDLSPTVLDFAGAPGPEALPGVSLLPALTGEADPGARSLVAEGTLYGNERSALVRWPMKLELDELTGELRLFDLERDPGETENLALTSAETAGRLHAELRRLLTEARSATTAEEIPLPEETLEALRAVGYLD